MEGIMGGSSGSEANAKTGLEGTGLDLPPNRHGNLKSASSDQNFKDILIEIKTSKTPVSFHNRQHCLQICLNFTWFHSNSRRKLLTLSTHFAGCDQLWCILVCLCIYIYIYAYMNIFLISKFMYSRLNGVYS